MIQSNVKALILAGGQSSRLGRDKTRIRFKGMTLLERSIGLARQFCTEVAVSGRDRRVIQGLDVDWVEDGTERIGPMGGILTGLHHFRAPVLVLACDLPLLDPATLGRLFKARDERPQEALMTTFVQRETGFIEALLAIYEPEATDLLEATLADGVYKLSRAIEPARRHHIPYDREEEPCFFNINFPGDLAILRYVEKIHTEEGFKL
ncbi:MAG TPA: molybdenum cofactor guanylyltransferase [Desulfomicrobiaceae bacterium]|jgi:molybdopterin-guanine dinucleotide biosynthesis protein A|nr:molybdenum cofactor guanylyltransferase [Desulfomicrobiaceae bacterium]